MSGGYLESLCFNGLKIFVAVLVTVFSGVFPEHHKGEGFVAIETVPMCPKVSQSVPLSYYIPAKYDIRRR